MSTASNWGEGYDTGWREQGLCRYGKKYWFGRRGWLHGSDAVARLLANRHRQR